jgi:hypothetical protein
LAALRQEALNLRARGRNTIEISKSTNYLTPDKSMARRFSLRELLMMLLIVLLAAIVYLQDSGLFRVSQRATIDGFHKLFYDSQVWMTTQWLGVPTAQNPNDAWIHQEIIARVKPDFIVEAGTWNGGSAGLWAMILQQVNPAG